MFMNYPICKKFKILTTKHRVSFISVYWVFVFCQFSISAIGQNISPMVINSGGGQIKANFFLDFSVGESGSIDYFENKNKVSLNAGFLQFYAPLVTGNSNYLFEEGEGFTLYPNPSKDYIRFKGIISNTGFFELHLIDNRGMIIEIFPKSFSTNYFDKEISIQNLSEGVYFLRLYFTPISGVTRIINYKFYKI